ncbi:MAG: plasmid mobilization relaxosome protein MobC, partial [Clostridia bacterium]|nr:plasmid mobilization relaxosome protein MobC [Clostridia bacterium]
NLCSRLRVNRSVLILALILGKRLVEAPPVDYKQFIIEFRRVGTNLNQLTAKANSIGFIDSDECRAVLNDVRNLETDIAKYFKPRKDENREWL